MAKRPRPLHDTLEEARIPDPDAVVKKWRSVRKDNVLAAARTIGELGELLRSKHAPETATSPHLPAASATDLTQIRNLLVDSESRISSGTARVKLWTDEIRALVDESAKSSELLGERLGERVGDVDGKVQHLADTVEHRTRLVNYWFAATVGIGVASIIFAVLLLILHTMDVI